MNGVYGRWMRFPALVFAWMSFEGQAKAFASTIKPIAGKFVLINKDSFRQRQIILDQPKRSIVDRSTTSLASKITAESFTAEVKKRRDENMVAVANPQITTDNVPPRFHRFRAALPGAHPGLPGLDRRILSTALPSMLQMAMVPLVSAVDTYWAGRSQNALALAGQSAANQVFFTFYFLVAFLPTLTGPLVAKAIGYGKLEEAQGRISESLFLSNVLGGLVTIFLALFTPQALSMVLQDGAPAIAYATPYLRLRAWSMVPALVTATGFAAYRGLLDTIPPLKVSLSTNLLNLALNPVLAPNMGFLGVAAAKVSSECASGITYMVLLLRKKLATWRGLWSSPSLKSLLPLVKGGFFVLLRQVALNIGMVMVARRAQSLDPATGFAAAAYEIVMQLYNIGVFCHLAMQGTAAALVPCIRAEKGYVAARIVADRLLVWNSLLGVCLGLVQWFTLPLTVPLFTSIPEVQQAVRLPALISSIVLAVNGIVFSGEGILMGLGHFRGLMSITVGAIASQCLCLSMNSLTTSLAGILSSLLVFKSLSAIAILIHHLRYSALAREKID